MFLQAAFFSGDTLIRRNSFRDHRPQKVPINEHIRAKEIRLIGADGSQVGVIDTSDALFMAQEAGLDLIEINATSEPPICKILDFGKHQYETKKQKSAAKKKQVQTQVKEVKFRPGTEDGDYKVKLRNLLRFLTDGNKAKVSLRFRGREMAHQQLGMNLMKRVEKDLAEVGIVEQYPKMEGRQLIMVIIPNKKKVI